MIRYIIGIVIGVFLVNVWQAYPKVVAERRSTLVVEVSSEKEPRVDPKTLFRHRQTYVIVRFDDDPKVAVVRSTRSTNINDQFFASHEELLQLEVGTKFFYDHNQEAFFALDWWKWA